MDQSERISKIDSFICYNHELQEDFLHNPENNTPSSSFRSMGTKEKYGALYVLAANFVWAFNSFYLKIVQRTYPTYFASVPFLFIRGFMIMFISFSMAYYNNEHILRPNEISHKFYFFIRTNLNFFSVTFFTVGVWYLRVSTCQIISTLNPIIVIVFSVFILKESFYFRYLIGIIVCLLGSSIIVLNEKKANSSVTAETTHEKTDTSVFSADILFGITCSLTSVLLGSFITIANKVLVKNKISITTQLVYVSFSTLLYSFIYIVITREFKICLGYIIMCLMHGVCFCLGNVFFNRGIQLIDLSKSVTISYMKIVFVFILGGLFLGEPIYFTDIIGACLIVSYMMYNVSYPIQA